MGLQKKIKQKTPEQIKKEQHNYIRETIQKLVKPERLKEEGAWAREYKIAKQLIKKYKEHKQVFANVNFKVNSLAFFLTDEGKNTIQKIINSINFVVKVNKVVELSEEKIGEDIKIEKPLSIKDFLQKYK